MRNFSKITVLLAATALVGCKTVNKAGDVVQSAGETVAEGASDLGSSAVSLVNVDLSNVLNDLALDLNIDKSNIPINAQIPITIAANICGVSINILSVSTGGSPNCTATTTSPELSQAVQQQMAANGNVGGGSQTTNPPAGSTSGTGASGTGTTPDETQQDPPQ